MAAPPPLSLDRLLALIAKEFRQTFRDPRMRVVLFVMPVVQLFIFSYAATTDLSRVATAVQDSDRTATSRELVARFEGSGTFAVVARPENDAEARHLLDTGKARVLIAIPPGLERDSLASRNPSIAVIADGTDANATAQVMANATRITAAYVAERAAEQAQRLGGRPAAAPVTLAARAFFNPNLESRPFYIPGLVVMIVTVVTLMLTAMAVVREREMGTLEQLLVTPLTSLELIIGKTTPFAVIGVIDSAIVLVVARLWFEIPMRGSLVLFFVAIASYLASTLAAGVLISTISRTQQQAMMGAFLFVFPAILLSGFMFPLDNMPALIQAGTLANPVRHMMTIMRALFLRGAGLELLWPNLIALWLIGAVVASLGVWRFRKTLG